jgi:hypothetical protein
MQVRELSAHGLVPKVWSNTRGQVTMTVHRPDWSIPQHRSWYTWIIVTSRGLADHSKGQIPLHFLRKGFKRRFGPCINKQPRDRNLGDLRLEDRRTCFWPGLNNGCDLRRSSSAQRHLASGPRVPYPAHLGSGRPQPALIAFLHQGDRR